MFIKFGYSIPVKQKKKQVCFNIYKRLRTPEVFRHGVRLTFLLERGLISDSGKPRLRGLYGEEVKVLATSTVFAQHLHGLPEDTRQVFEKDFGKREAPELLVARDVIHRRVIPLRIPEPFETKTKRRGGHFPPRQLLFGRVSAHWEQHLWRDPDDRQHARQRKPPTQIPERNHPVLNLVESPRRELDLSGILELLTDILIRDVMWAIESLHCSLRGDADRIESDKKIYHKT